MKLSLKRRWFTSSSTIGELSIDGEQFCFTLERPRDDRPNANAPFCIPVGTYPILLQKSNRFNMITPHLQNVPGRTFIEIHPGNYPTDTEGCILVGSDHIVNAIEHSRDTFTKLMSKLLTAHDKLEIEVS